VLTSEVEHRSNIISWQLLRDRLDINFVSVPIGDTDGFDLAAFEKRLTPQTKLVAIMHLFNLMCHVMAVEEIINLTHVKGANVLLNASQNIRRLIVISLHFLGINATVQPVCAWFYAKHDILEAILAGQGRYDSHNVSRRNNLPRFVVPL